MTFVIAFSGPSQLPIRRVFATLAMLGALAFLFGVVTIAWPAVTLVALAILFGLYAIINGVMLIAASLRAWVPNRVISAVLGVVDLAAGVIALGWPGVTVVALAVVVGAWALVTGAVEAVVVSRLWRTFHEVHAVAWPGVRAVLALVAGILILARPVAGAFGVALVVGVYALICAGVLFGLAWQLRRATTERERPAGRRVVPTGAGASPA
jgi:uncharacterized membrane protein HdeD (DUF308 family)